MQEKHLSMKSKHKSTYSTKNEVEEMKYFLCSPTIFRYSKFNSDELNKSNEGDERVSSTESVEKWGVSGICDKVKP